MRKLVESLASLGKVLIKSRPLKKPAPDEERRRLVVMGNGPSLRQTIAEFGDELRVCDTMAVNFAANTEEFFRLRPRHYVLADPHFFSRNFAEGAGSEGRMHPNVETLWANIARADWPLTLHVPVGAKLPELPQKVTIRRFNMTPAEGYRSVTHFLYRCGLAMPRPRNVLVPALMEGIREGYKEIYVVGADHSWPHTLHVDERNRVVTVQPHFYKENQKELDRIAEAYANVRLHEVLGSMVVAFRSYHEVEAYSRSRGVKIYNATPESLIDAFERRSLGGDRRDS